MGKHGRTDEQRINDLIDKNAPSGHWRWRGAWAEGKPRYVVSQGKGDVRRLLTKGMPAGDGYRIIPACGDQWCVRPEHMMAAGRVLAQHQYKPAKLDRVVSGLIQLCRKHGATLQEIADVMGCSKQAVQQRIPGRVKLK
jgi:hypothetical protein